VLYEAGLVVDMRCGDAIVFKSSNIGHFNLHYAGKRASLVLHSDRDFDRWVLNRNNWESNRYYRK